MFIKDVTKRMDRPLLKIPPRKRYERLLAHKALKEKHMKIAVDAMNAVTIICGLMSMAKSRTGPKPRPMVAPNPFRIKSRFVWFSLTCAVDLSHIIRPSEARTVRNPPLIPVFKCMNAPAAALSIVIARHE